MPWNDGPLVQIIVRSAVDRADHHLRTYCHSPPDQPHQGNLARAYTKRDPVDYYRETAPVIRPISSTGRKSYTATLTDAGKVPFTFDIHLLPGAAAKFH